MHTSVPYSLSQLAKGTPEEEVRDELLRRVNSLLPWLPPHTCANMKTWQVSQVRYPIALPGNGPTACWPLAPEDGGRADGTDVTSPPLVLAGDAFSPLGSRFDGCVQSGEEAATELARALGVE